MCSCYIYLTNIWLTLFIFRENTPYKLSKSLQQTHSSNALQRDVVNLWYFKLKLFDLEWYIVWNIQDLYDATLGGKDKGIRKIEFVAKTQFLYAEKEWDLKKNDDLRWNLKNLSRGLNPPKPGLNLETFDTILSGTNHI